MAASSCPVCKDLAAFEYVTQIIEGAGECGIIRCKECKAALHFVGPEFREIMAKLDYIESKHKEPRIVRSRSV